MKALAIILAAPLSLAAGFYTGCFGFRLAAHALFHVVAFGVVLLHLLGVSHPRLGDPAIFLDLARASETAMLVAGALGGLAALGLVTRTALTSGGRRATRSTAGLAAFAVLAGAADLFFNVTPFVDRLLPPADLASAQRSVTCRMTVRDITEHHRALGACIAEVEGVLVYSRQTHRFELLPDGGNFPSVSVAFFRGRRTPFSDIRVAGKPRYYDQVRAFEGKRVRVIGTEYQGYLSVNVGHIVLADSP